MILGSLARGGRDGTLVVVSQDRGRFAEAPAIAATLQEALDRWREVAPRLQQLAWDVDAERIPTLPVATARFGAPLPRAYEWLDGSAFLAHVERARRARGASLPEDLTTVPLMYQGGSGVLLGPGDDVGPFAAEAGLDFEAEIACITADVPMGVTERDAAAYIRLYGLANDWTLRGLVPAELARGFGFVQGKPATAFAPFVVTPDELPDTLAAGRPDVQVTVTLNQTEVGCLSTAEMHFSFAALVAHAARTRALTAGTIIGSGTISNRDEARGVACLVERRALEAIQEGSAHTPYLAPEDRVVINARSDACGSVFGTIDQRVRRAEGTSQTEPAPPATGQAAQKASS